MSSKLKTGGPALPPATEVAGFRAVNSMKIKTLFSHSSAAQSIAWNRDAVSIILGSLYIALLAQVEIPLVPVPVTLHTFALFTLALFQGSKRSFFSVVLYLFEGTMGLPVFPGAHSDPFWILAPSAGYCISFPLAAYVAGRFAEYKKPLSLYWVLLGLCCSQALIYAMGASWLCIALGWKEAVVVGILPFVPFALVKLFAAAAVKMGVEHFICFEKK